MNQPTDTWQPGTVVQGPTHRYTLVRQLGAGGFGTTWLASTDKGADSGDDNGTGAHRQVALKTLHIGRLKDWKALELFERETAVLRKLSHPRIPAYVDDFRLGDDPDQPDGLVLVQQFFEGAPLTDAVAGQRSMDEAAIVSWMAQLLDVLDHLHGQVPPVIHRDITPKNILVDAHGQAALVDFGTVQAAVRSAQEVSSTSAGTFGFAPMEQFVGAAFPSSDQYGLAMTVLAVASGKNPEDMGFSGVRVDVRALVRFDARLVLLLERMTEPDPERRLPSAALALEQLRPLVLRYSGAADEGQPSAAAMRQVAAIYRKERATTGRATTADEDLLPSEQIAEAGQRLALLGGDALRIPTYKDTIRYARRSAVAGSGELASVHRFVLDIRTWKLRGKLRNEHFPAAFDTTGEVIAAADDGSWRDGHVHVYRRGGGGYEHAVAIETEMDDPAIALSPDGALVCLSDGKQALLFDARTGGQTQRIAGHWATAHFLRDGSGLLLVNRDQEQAKLLLGDGREQRIQGVETAALSVDGRLLATFGDKGAQLWALDGGQAKKKGGVFGPKDVTWRGAGFSADGRWLAACNYSRDVIEVYDVAAGQHIGTVRNPNAPKQRVGSVCAVGFSASGDRLLVGADLHFSRYFPEDEDCLAVWSMPELDYLGAVLLEEGDRRPLLVSARGFVGPVGKGKGSSKGKVQVQGPLAATWVRPEVAIAAQLGQPEAELLDEKGRAQVADLEARWRHAHDLQAAGTIDKEAALAEVVDALTGLTHLVDEVVARGRTAQKGAVTFGGGQKATALTLDHIKTAAAELLALPASEREVLYEQALGKAKAAEALKARRFEKKAPKKKPARVAVEAKVAPERGLLAGIDEQVQQASEDLGLDTAEGRIEVRNVVITAVVLAVIAWLASTFF